MAFIKLYFLYTNIDKKFYHEWVLLLLLLLSRSHVQFCVTPEMAAHQAPMSLGFSKQEHWRGLPLPSPDWMLNFIKNVCIYVDII